MSILHALGGEDGCRRLSQEFYSRVATDKVLKPLFPGKSLRCATEEFAAFLIQFLGGDEDQAQFRWRLSLRESHARFQISTIHRAAWLKMMDKALRAMSLNEKSRQGFWDMFQQASASIIGIESTSVEHTELNERWNEQLSLDAAVSAIQCGNDKEAVKLTPRFLPRPSIYVGLLARMVQSRRAALIDHVTEQLGKVPDLISARSNGRTLLHDAAAAGSLKVVDQLINLGANVNALDGGSHTPLYSVANGCPLETGPAIVRTLVKAGADVNACEGVTKATPLHMAARRGHAEIARTLIDCGATIDAKDKKGDTPLRRARNCRKDAIVKLLVENGASAAR